MRKGGLLNGHNLVTVGIGMNKGSKFNVGLDLLGGQVDYGLMEIVLGGGQHPALKCSLKE